MRKARFLNITFALALVAGLFAASLASVAALSPVYGPEIAGTPSIFFPFVYNGTTLSGVGPYNGSITIQNQNALQISVDITTAGGASLADNVLFNPRASKTWSASQLGVADGGEGVIATASWTNSSIETMLTLQMCAPGNTYTETITKGDPQGTDALAHSPVFGVTALTADAGATTYTEGTDFSVDHVNGEIDWSPAGLEPESGSQYQVTYTTADCGDPTIGGVEKHVAPVQNSIAVKTDSSQQSVDGYSAVGYCDLAVAMDELVSGCDLGQGLSLPELNLENQSRWILPIAQTNNGWNSVIHVTNVSGDDGVGVSALFYDAGGQGVNGNSEQLFSTTLDSGGSVNFDLMADGNFEEGRVGSVWIDADEAVVASVDRVKAATNMALTNVAQPRNDNTLNYIRLLGSNPTTKYASLVFQDYNNWNTGINIANLSSSVNSVDITFYNYLDNSTSVESVDIPPRAMEYVYMPGTGNDIGLHPSGISAAVISGSEPLVAAVDEVKYTGGQGVGHAMSYPAQYGAFAGLAYDTSQFPALDDLFQIATGFGTGRVFYNWQLDLPLLQKGSHTTGLGDYSGINLFNADPSHGVTAWVQFVDTAGIPVAPTTLSNEAEDPIQVPIGSLASHTIYTDNFDSLPSGFTGSAVVGVVGTSIEDLLAKTAEGPLVGVSNNVNYAVSGDGSSVFNMNPSFHFLPGELGLLGGGNTPLPPGCFYPSLSILNGTTICIPGVFPPNP